VYRKYGGAKRITFIDAILIIALKHHQPEDRSKKWNPARTENQPHKFLLENKLVFSGLQYRL
jgi:hypothetical protein